MKREIHKFIQSLLNILHVIMFPESQRIWIVTNFRKEKRLAQLRRNFLREYKPVNHKTVPNLKAFQIIITTFEDWKCWMLQEKMWTETSAGYQDFC